MNNAEAAIPVEPIQKHSLPQSILLHLLPGVLIVAAYALLVGPFRRLGFPSITAQSLTALLVLIPFELGYLLREGRKTGARRQEGIVLYRQPLPVKQYRLWVPVLFVASAVIMTAFTPVSSYFESLFSWFPDALRLDMGFESGSSRSVLIINLILNFLLITVTVPAVEELYFRGYLLPRMPELGGRAPVVHSALFALYHVWTPCVFAARLFAVLPLIYIVRWKRNLYLGMLAHILLNTIDIVMGVAFPFQMG